jgi:hypothetical protein
MPLGAVAVFSAKKRMPHLSDSATPYRYNSVLGRILTCQLGGECPQIAAFYLCKLKI